jgi:hypothetical protein
MEIICIQNKCVVPDKEDISYQEYMKSFVQLQLQEHDWANETYVTDDDGELVQCLIPTTIQFLKY